MHGNIGLLQALILPHLLNLKIVFQIKYVFLYLGQAHHLLQFPTGFLQFNGIIFFNKISHHKTGTAVQSNNVPIIVIYFSYIGISKSILQNHLGQRLIKLLIYIFCQSLYSTLFPIMSAYLLNQQFLYFYV